jgi:serine/threonine-protein kinase
VSGASIDALLERIASQSHYEDRYALRERLFAGGMGAVYSAFDRILRREIAIKLMQPGAATTPAGRGQFLKEARVAGRLLHPNVLPVFDVGVNRRKELYYTMRLVRGASLRRSLDAVATGCATNLVSFPLGRVVGAFQRVCQGIDFAHQNRVLHLDLKPDNVLVSGFNEVFVIDWGLARVDDEDDTERLIDLYRNRDVDVATTGVFEGGGGHVIGTVAYMAPEQAHGNYQAFSPATDIYGLGGILYYILYDAPPNQSSGPGGWGELFASITQPKKPGKLRAGILPRGERVRKELRDALADLERICLKALAPEPCDRYATAEDLIIELNEWLVAQKAFPSP